MAGIERHRLRSAWQHSTVLALKIAEERENKRKRRDTHQQERDGKFAQRPHIGIGALVAHLRAAKIDRLILYGVFSAPILCHVPKPHSDADRGEAVMGASPTDRESTRAKGRTAPTRR